VIKPFFFVTICVLLPLKLMAVEIIPARVLASYWVDNSAGVSLSGLSFCDQLVTISAKNPKEIYTLKVNGERAELVPHITLFGLKPLKGEKPTNIWHFILDLFRPASVMRFHGVCCRADYTFVVSERYNRVAEIDRDGRANWQEHVLSPAIKHRGYLLRYNNGGEGLVQVDDDLWVAIEREPRGLLKLEPNGEFQVRSLPPVDGLDFRGRPENLRGLDYYDGALFTLESNAHAVCRRSLPGLNAEWCLVYRRHEESPEHAYQVSRFGGNGAGVAVNDQGIFVVFNNNNISRAQVPHDRRGLMLHLAFPEGSG